MIFKFFGIKVTVSYIFCAYFCAMLLCDKTGLFMYMVLAALLHETGHLLVMKIYNCRPSEVKFIPGSVQICSPICVGKPTVLILLAGPLFNILAFMLMGILGVFGDLAQINLIYAVFNLLPFYGLDGGGVLEEIIIRKKGALFAEKVLKTVTGVGAMMFLLLAIILALAGVVNYSAYIISLYLFLSVIFKL